MASHFAVIAGLIKQLLCSKHRPASFMISGGFVMSPSGLAAMNQCLLEAGSPTTEDYIEMFNLDNEPH